MVARTEYVGCSRKQRENRSAQVRVRRTGSRSRSGVVIPSDVARNVVGRTRGSSTRILDAVRRRVRSLADGLTGEDVERQFAELRRELAEREAKLEDIERRREALRQQIQETKSDPSAQTEETVGDLERQTSELTASVDEMKESVAVTDARVNAMTKALRQRTVRIKRVAARVALRGSSSRSRSPPT